MKQNPNDIVVKPNIGISHVNVNTSDISSIQTTRTDAFIKYLYGQSKELNDVGNAFSNAFKIVLDTADKVSINKVVQFYRDRLSSIAKEYPDDAIAARDKMLRLQSQMLGEDLKNGEVGDPELKKIVEPFISKDSRLRETYTTAIQNTTKGYGRSLLSPILNDTAIKLFYTQKESYLANVNNLKDSARNSFLRANSGNFDDSEFCVGRFNLEYAQIESLLNTDFQYPNVVDGGLLEKKVFDAGTQDLCRQNFSNILLKDFCNLQASKNNNQDNLALVKEIRSGAIVDRFNDTQEKLGIGFRINNYDPSVLTDVADGIIDNMRNKIRIDKQLNSINLVKDATSGMAIQDTNIPEYRKAVNDFYTSVVLPQSAQSLLNSRNVLLTDQERAQNRNDIISSHNSFLEKVKYVPGSLCDTLNDFANDSSSDNLFVTCNIYSAIHSNKFPIDPTATAFYDNLGAISYCTQLVNSGVSAEEAHKTLQDIKRLSPEERNTNSRKAYQLLNDENSSNQIVSRVLKSAGISNNDLVVPNEARRDIEESFVKYFSQTRDINSACDATALRMLNEQQYGVSSLSGSNVLAKAPVEKLYASTVTKPQDVHELIKGGIARFNPKALYGSRQLQCDADDQTMQEIANGESPTYPIYIAYEDGLVMPLVDDNLNHVRISKDWFMSDNYNNATGITYYNLRNQQIDILSRIIDNENYYNDIQKATISAEVLSNVTENNKADMDPHVVQQKDVR